jgi:deoxycytidylate deaminase
MPHNYDLTNNPFQYLPTDVMAKIFRFVQDYELLGLGKVCRAFRRMLRESGLYDPFVLDSPYTRWNDLGYSAEATFSADLATLAYAKIKETLTEEVEEPNLRKGITLEVQTRTETLTALSKTLRLNTTNCLAQLKLGDKSLIAVNFTKTDQHLAALTKAGESLKSETRSDYKKVTNRHAEMRLIMQLTEPTQEADAELIIDKLCCVFCAAQIYALGFKKLLTGWHTNPLQWYNFSPSVMFFPRRRVKIWGEEVEEEFRMLPPESKVAFLYTLAQKAAQLEEIAEEKRVYLDVPIQDKEEARLRGAKWNKYLGLWYGNSDYPKQIAKWRQHAKPEEVKKWQQDAKKRKNVSPESGQEAKKVRPLPFPDRKG